MIFAKAGVLILIFSIEHEIRRIFGRPSICVIKSCDAKHRETTILNKVFRKSDLFLTGFVYNWNDLDIGDLQQNICQNVARIKNASVHENWFVIKNVKNCESDN